MVQAQALNGVTGSNFNLTATSQSITLQPGEYHIYVSVPGCTVPPTPTGLNATNITTTSATLNWTVSAGNFYTVDYKPASSGSWINAVTAVSSGSATVVNLTPGTLYDWRVSVNCTANPVNNFSTAQFSTTSHNNQINNVKEGYGLKISPNPVRGNAIIDYVIAGRGGVTIDVVNPQGQKIKTLLNKILAAGQYRFAITHELTNLPKGIYFLVLRQNNNCNIVKFVKY